MSWLSGLFAVLREGLVDPTDGKPHLLELGLCEHGQHVALVLVAIDAPEQPPPSVGVFVSCIVTRHQDFALEIAHLVDEAIELDGSVALDARVRRSPRDVVGEESVDDAF